MSISFQPKIIIGSVVGFIATAIGVIAVFFPSLFDLETKKIDEYKITLKNESDYRSLINFLVDHQNTIVNLDINYFEKKRYELKKDENGIYTEFDFDDYGEGDKTGKLGRALIDNNGKYFVSSEFYMPLAYDNLFRQNGGIGIWFRSNSDDLNKDESYFIMINKDSSGNKLYKWSFALNDDREEMKISGDFFVNKIVDDEEYGEDISVLMSPQWADIMCADGGGDKCYSIKVIDLEPLSKKEIESKKY